MTLCLSKAEIEELTGRVRPSAQVRVLKAMGIDHKTRPDGTVFVLRDLLNPGAQTKVKSREPNWKALATQTQT